jgi:hypothetical protein
MKEQECRICEGAATSNDDHQAVASCSFPKIGLQVQRQHVIGILPVPTAFDGMFHPDGMHVVFCGSTIIIIIARGSICPKT